jgi:Na+/melibiose symporter-like transporter
VVTEFLGWWWVLFVNVPVALAVVSLARIVIHESKDEAAPRTLDLAGAATATLGLASLIYALSEAPKNGWASPATLCTTGLGAVFLKSMVGAAQLYVLTLYFQDALGRTPLEAGLLVVPMTRATVVTSPVAGRLTTRLGARQTAAWGFAMSEAA